MSQHEDRSTGHSPSGDSHPAGAANSSASDSFQLSAGDRLGRYVLLDALGRGGMGVVFEAIDTRLGRTVALKLLSGVPDAAGRARMIREAEALAKLNHPNVVTVFDGGTVDDVVYVAMERVHGVSLSQFARERGPTNGALLAVFLKAGAGLAAAHRAGIVHRDFKPSNVMVADDGGVRVIDFGLVKLDEQTEQHPPTEEPSPSSTPKHRGEADSADTTTLTVLGAYPGTAVYMSPEQHLGRVADYRSDQFSFSVALFECLTGHLPFAFHSGAGFVEQVQSKTWHASGERLDRDIRRILRRGLSADPDARYPDLDALLNDLKAHKLRKRARLWTLGGALVVAITLGIGWISGAPRRECLAKAVHVDTLWDQSTRGRIQRAFMHVSKKYGAPTFAKIDENMRQFVAEYAEQVRESCEMTHGQQTQPVPVLEDRLQCLEAAKLRVEKVVEQWKTPSQTTINFAVSEAISTAHVGECGADVDPRVLERRPPGVSPDDYSGFLQLFGEIERLQRSGELDAAKEIAIPLASGARDNQSPLLLARALGALGNTQRMLSDYETAKATLQEAITLAVQAGDVALEISLLDKLAYAHLGAGDLEVTQAVARLALPRATDLGMRDTAMTLLLVDGFASEEQGAFEAAERVIRRALRVAEAKLAPHAQARVITSLGQLLSRQMRYEAALPLAERGHRVFVEQFGPLHQKSLRALMTLAQVYRGLRRLDDAERCYREAVEFAPSLAIRASALGQLGSIQLRGGRYTEAVATLSEARAAQESVLGPNHTETLRTAGTLAVALTKNGDFESARRYFDRALLQSEGSSGTDRVVALVNSSYLEFADGNFSVVLARLDEAETLAVKLYGDGAMVPFLIRSLRAQTRERQERFAESLRLHRRAFALVEDLGKLDADDLAAARISLARVVCAEAGDRPTQEATTLLSQAQPIVQNSVDPALKTRYALARAACE